MEKTHKIDMPNICLRFVALLSFMILILFAQSCKDDNSSKNGSFVEGWKEVLYEAPDNRAGSVVAFIKDGWLNLQRRLPSEEMLWHIILAQATDSLPPKVTFKARDDGSKYPSYAVITYKDGVYFIKDDGFYLRCRRQLKNTNHSSWLQPPPISDYNQLCSAGYGCNDLVGWAGKSQLIVGTGGPNDMSDCMVNLAYLEPEEEIEWMASATKMGVRSFSYKEGEAFLHDDGELLLAKMEIVKKTLSTSRNERNSKIAAGLPAPEFKFQQVLVPNKNKLSIGEFRDKVLLLDFWGMWCEPCIKNLPKLQKLYDTFKDKDFIVIGVHSLRSCDKLDEFVEKHNITYPITIASEEMQKDYDITSWPTYILVDRKDKIISISIGTLPTNGEIERILQRHNSKGS